MTNMTLPYMKTPCANCPFKKDTRKGWLGKERMTSILETNSFVCHKHNDMQCAGHMTLATNNIFVKTANQYKITLDIKNTDLIFKSKELCIEHHT